MSAAQLLPGSLEAQRSRWERKRRRAAQELLESERRYLDRLGPVVTYFVAILEAKGTLKPAERETIFGCLELICSASRILLTYLEQGHLRSGLEHLCHHLVLYVRYAENLEKAEKCLEKQLRKNQSFGRFKKLQESRPELQGSRLEELLPLPLERLCQYQQLLQDVVENTSPRSPDFQPLTGLLRLVTDACCQVEEICRCRENVKQMCRVQKLLKGQKTRIQAPGRCFLHEGWLMLVPPKRETLQRRMLFLFSDILVVSKACHPLHPWNSHKFACQGVFPLQECVVEKVFGHTQGRGGLLSLSFPHQKLLLMSCDQEELNRWHRCLLTAVRWLQRDSRQPAQALSLRSSDPGTG